MLLLFAARVVQIGGSREGKLLAQIAAGARAKLFPEFIRVPAGRISRLTIKTDE